MFEEVGEGAELICVDLEFVWEDGEFNGEVSFGDFGFRNVIRF